MVDLVEELVLSACSLPFLVMDHVPTYPRSCAQSRIESLDVVDALNHV